MAISEHEKRIGITRDRFKDHHGYYLQLAKIFGVGWPDKKEKFMSKTKEYWENLYDKDKHLNNHPLRYFDVHYASHAHKAAQLGFPFSLSQTVCMLKAVIIDRIISDR